MEFNTSVEQEVKDYLRASRKEYTDNSSSFKNLDFTLTFGEGKLFHLDVKEKRQRYNLNNWPKIMIEADMFILDDLSIRKCLAFSPNSGILVRDNIRAKYFFVSVLDFALMPKKRVNRQINRNQPDIKGKWIINLRNGKEAISLQAAFLLIEQYVQNLEEVLFKILECYGEYVDEIIGQGGITRKPSHWEIDVKSTR